MLSQASVLEAFLIWFLHLGLGAELAHLLGQGCLPSPAASLTRTALPQMLYLLPLPTTGGAPETAGSTCFLSSQDWGSPSPKLQALFTDLRFPQGPSQ